MPYLRCYLQTTVCTRLRQKQRRPVVLSSQQVVAATTTQRISLETWKPSTNGMSMVSIAIFPFVLFDKFLLFGYYNQLWQLE